MVFSVGALACDPGPALIRIEMRDGNGGVPAGAVAELLSTSSGEALAHDVVRETGQLAWRVPRSGAAMVVFARSSNAAGPDRARLPIVLLPGTETTVRATLPDSGAATARVGDPGSRHERWTAAILAADALRSRRAAAIRSWRAAGHEGPLRMDWRGEPDSLRAVIDTTADAVVREALWYQLLMYGRLDAGLRPAAWSRILTGIRPASPVWSWAGLNTPLYIRLAARGAEAAGRIEGTTTAADSAEPEAVAGRRALAGRRAAEYFRRGAAEHPDPATRAVMLLGGMRVAVELGETEQATALFRRLEAQYPDTPAYRRARAEAPGVALEEGDQLPGLVFPPLDGAGPPITPADLRGRWVLIDFWATWCVPCVAEMPTLHAAHERFGGRGFEILSVSYDEERGDVRSFRAERWPMPWIHSFAGLDALGGGAIAERYGITGLPRAMLIDPDGRVVAIDEGLRGEALAKTLAELLEES